MACYLPRVRGALALEEPLTPEAKTPAVRAFRRARNASASGRPVIRTAHSLLADTTAAVEEAYVNLVLALAGAPDLCVCHLTSTHDGLKVARAFRRVAGAGVKFAGGTSCRGVMTEKGYHSNGGTALALWGLRKGSRDAAVGVGGRAAGNDPAAAAKAAAEEALAALDGRPADMLWLVGTPGNEEAVLRGIAEATGGAVPVCGGSAADNEVKGEWYVLCGGAAFVDGVAVVAIRSGDHVVPIFDCGYAPSSRTAKVTALGGGSARVVAELDGQPAAEPVKIP